MPREYYDRAHSAEKILPATREQQDAYWFLRSQLTQAIARDWNLLLAASPAVSTAQDNLDRLVDSNPTRTFRIFRPEDHNSGHSAGDARIFLR